LARLTELHNSTAAQHPANRPTHQAEADMSQPKKEPFYARALVHLLPAIHDESMASEYRDAIRALYLVILEADGHPERLSDTIAWLYAESVVLHNQERAARVAPTRNLPPRVTGKDQKVLTFQPRQGGAR
jgi:hypothetical protein